MHRFIKAIAVTFLLGAAAQATALDSPEEYIEIFASGLQIEKEKAVESLAWAGLQAPEVFDPIEAELLAQLPNERDKVSINYLSWLTKALAFSGNPKYAPTLERVEAEAGNRKLQKYARQAQEMLPDYTRYNAIIAPEPWPENPYPSIEQRLLNMLASSEFELIRIAAKRIHYTHNYQKPLLDALAQTLQSHYQKDDLSSMEVDALSWAAKALAGSRELSYKPTIETVAGGAGESKLGRYANKYLRYYTK